MKKLLTLCAFIIFSCSSDNDPRSEPKFNVKETVLPTVSNIGFDYSTTDIEGWELIWEDNFNGDLSNWNVWKGGAFNGELQFYQPDNLYIDKGYLFIEQLRESITGVASPTTSVTKSFDFTSGRLETIELYSPSSKGTLRIAARVKLPKGEGLAPSFWNDGDPWPTQGQIDIMELRGGKTNEYVTNFFYGTEPDTPLNNPAITGYTHDTGIDLTEEFHIFDAVWSQNSIVFSLDGVEVRTLSSSEFPYVEELFNKNQQVVLNTAVGGLIFEGENFNVAAVPAKSYFIIDWVKIFKQQ